MKLVLMRHGPPQFSLDQKLKAYELTAATLDYKYSPLRDDTIVPQASLEIARQCQFILCSELPRALQSLECMRLQPHVSDALFNESDLPHIRLPGPALPIKVWGVLFRLLSLFSFGCHGESAAQLKRRTARVVDTLETHAVERQSVLLMGHGFVNYLAGKELRRRGWRRTQFHGHSHWAYAIFENADKK